MKKEIIDSIQNIKNNHIEKDVVIETLKVNTTLTSSEKNLIIAYCFPRPLGDYELPKRVQSYRGENKKGTLELNETEVILILEAGQTQQYGRFIKHLMHAFGDPAKVFPVEGEETDDCAICGKSLYEFKTWENLVENVRPGTPEKQNKEWLAYGSTESGITLCLDCLTQLIAAKEMIEQLDPGFLDWTKRKVDN